MSRSGLLVKRHCPYCKDDLHAEPEVFCARCFTSHHGSCFSENRGCSIFGCSGKDSVSVGERDDRPLEVQSLPQFLATCAALLVMGLATGWFFETRHNRLMEQLIASTRRIRAAECERNAEEVLLAIREAQLHHRDAAPGEKSDGTFAATIEELTTSRTLYRFKAWGYAIHMVRSRSAPGERFEVLALTQDDYPSFSNTLLPIEAREGVALGPDGGLVRIRPAIQRAWWGKSTPRTFFTDRVSIDEDTCALVEPPVGGNSERHEVDSAR